MGYKERCCYCEVALDSVQNKTSKTEDGHTVCIDCYHKIFNDLFKGQFTFEEGLTVLHKRLMYEELLQEYLLVVKKLAKANDFTHEKALEEILKLETDICKFLFNSERQPVLQDINKHIKVLTKIMEDNHSILGLIFPIMDIRNISNSSYNIDYNTRLLDVEYKNITNNIVITI